MTKTLMLTPSAIFLMIAGVGAIITLLAAFLLNRDKEKVLSKPAMLSLGLIAAAAVYNDKTVSYLLIGIAILAAASDLVIDLSMSKKAKRIRSKTSERVQKSTDGDASEDHFHQE